MRLFFTERFKNSYRDAPRIIQLSCDKQFFFLEKNIRHPSLHAKKYDERHGIWQARATQSWRFYFLFNNEGVTLLDLISHPK